MKLTLERIADGDEEVIIRYYEMKEEIEAIAGIVRGTGLRILAVWEGQTLLLLPELVYYMENVEQVMISRKYAKELRQILKGGARDEE